MNNLTSYDRRKANYHKMLAKENWKLSPEKKWLIALSLYIIGVVVLIKLLGIEKIIM